MKNSNSAFLMLKTLSVFAFIFTLVYVGIVYFKSEKLKLKNETSTIAKKTTLENKNNNELYTPKTSIAKLNRVPKTSLRNNSETNTIEKTSKIAIVENSALMNKDSVFTSKPVSEVSRVVTEMKLDEKILKNNIELENTKTSEVVIKKPALKSGGMPNFYKTVAAKFDDDIIDDGAEDVKVLVSFAIEKNGEMTNIKVENSKNKYISNEAIRVLKSLKTKWEPATKNNELVRTEYVLPITVKSE